MTFSTTKRKVSVTSHVYILLFVYIYVHPFLARLKAIISIFLRVIVNFIIFAFVFCVELSNVFFYTQHFNAYLVTVKYFYFIIQEYTFGVLILLFLFSFLCLLTCYHVIRRVANCVFFGKRVTNK